MRIGTRPDSKPKAFANVPDDVYERALELQERNQAENGKDLSLSKCIALVKQQQKDEK